MPELVHRRDARWAYRIQRAVIVTSIAALACAACTFTGDDRAQGPAIETQPSLAEPDPWVLDGTNAETLLADISVEEWAALMESYGVAELPGYEGEEYWVGTAPDDTRVATWWNGDGKLTEVNCHATASSIEEALATLEFRYTSVAVEGFDPTAAGDWLDDRAGAFAELEEYVNENQAFGPVGLMLLASRTESADCVVSLTLRPTGSSS